MNSVPVLPGVACRPTCVPATSFKICCYFIIFNLERVYITNSCQKKTHVLKGNTHSNKTATPLHTSSWQERYVTPLHTPSEERYTHPHRSATPLANTHPHRSATPLHYTHPHRSATPLHTPSEERYATTHTLITTHTLRGALCQYSHPQRSATPLNTPWSLHTPSEEPYASTHTLRGALRHYIHPQRRATPLHTPSEERYATTLHTHSIPSRKKKTTVKNATVRIGRHKENKRVTKAN